MKRRGFLGRLVGGAAAALGAKGASADVHRPEGLTVFGPPGVPLEDIFEGGGTVVVEIQPPAAHRDDLMSVSLDSDQWGESVVPLSPGDQAFMMPRTGTLRGAEGSASVCAGDQISVRLGDAPEVIVNGLPTGVVPHLSGGRIA